jgi:hypothetical protein
MLKTLIFTIAIVGSAVTLLAIKLLVKGDARGPMQHIGASKAMRERGIGCVESMDARERFERAHRPHAKERKNE